MHLMRWHKTCQVNDFYEQIGKFTALSNFLSKLSTTILQPAVILQFIWETNDFRTFPTSNCQFGFPKYFRKDGAFNIVDVNRHVN